MVIFSETETQLNFKEIEEIEKLVGLKFPEPYKSHLLKYNGGRCFPNIFHYYENNGKFNASDVDWFLAIYDGEYNNMMEYIELLKIDQKRMPNHIVPIAHDSGGNAICISCAGEDLGYIYFWDHENEVDYSISDDSDYSNLYLIATSFNEFIDGLKDDITNI